MKTIGSPVDAKVSVYSTVLNEENSIGALLESIISQTRKPDEIIIVDGGSTDRTVEIIQEYIKRNKLIKLIVAKGSNVAQGRNTAIQNTNYDVVASIDAGCVADRFWLENLIKKLDENTDIITGVCLPDAKNTFEICFSELLYPSIDAFKADWPSHQNFAFRKYVWEKIKYPENCYRSEDTWFNLKAREMGFKFELAKDAIVYWRPRRNLKEVFKNSYIWAKSNIENDVRAEITSKIALNNLGKLTWKTLSVIALLTVFIYVSKLGAIMLSPFILKNIINLYGGERKITRIVYKNLIDYTNALANGLGFVSGKMTALNKR